MSRTEYILDWSLGVRVGRAWLNVEVMKRSGVFDSLGSGIAIRMWELAVAGVGGGGRARKSGSCIKSTYLPPDGAAGAKSSAGGISAVPRPARTPGRKAVSFIQSTDHLASTRFRKLGLDILFGS